jgi:hypothetical protein
MSDGSASSSCPSRATKNLDRSEGSVPASTQVAVEEVPASKEGRTVIAAKGRRPVNKK